MDALFPINDIGLVHRQQLPRVMRCSDTNEKSLCEKYDERFPADISKWTDEDHECFLAALLEMEQEDRARLGLLGRWPLYEIREWGLRNPGHAETALGAAVIIAGIAIGVLWHILSPLFSGP
jgi:hypothetical protein